MTQKISRNSIWIRSNNKILIFSIAILFQSTMALAGSLSWLDDVIQASMRQADPKLVSSRPARLFNRETSELGDDGLGILARRSDELSGLARKSEEPAAGLVDARFSRLVGNDENLARDFARLTPSEKKLAVVMGEAAQKIARRFPGQADTMIRKMGADGLSAVAVYGDDVAEVLATEGPQAVNVLRKTGRPGWKFFTESVLPNKQKLAAAGILTVFIAAPEEFVDMAGQATEYAVRQFASAGIELASAVSGGAVSGLESAVGNWLESQGLNFTAVRYIGMFLAGWVVLTSAMFLLGLPGRIAVAPITAALWPVRRFIRVIRG
ncbi:MAG: hypothetical protein ACKO5E_03325 [bacterium]